MKEEKRKAPRLRFPGFDGDWEQCKLGNICSKIGSGKTPFGGSNSYCDSGVPLIRSQNVNNDRVDLSDVVFINETIDESMSNSRVYKDDVLLNITGASIGRSAVYKGNVHANVNQHVCIIRPHKGYMPDFIQLHLTSENGQKQVELNQAGGGREGLNFQQIGSMYFSFPSIDEQQEIAGFLMHLDKAITLHQQKLEQIKEYKKGMLQKMFPKKGETVPEVRFPGFEGDWEERKLGEAVALRGRIGFRGYTQADLVDAGSGAITFSPSDIDDAGNVSLTDNKYISWEKYEESPEIKVRIGDILFTKTASIGKVGYVRELKEKATINPQFALLTPNGETDGYFTFLSVRTEEFMKKVRDITGGSSVPTMSQEKLKELTFLVPALDEQQNISGFFAELDTFITLYQRKLEQMKEYKKGLLQQMFV